MHHIHPLDNSYEARLQRKMKQLRWQHMRLDPWLLLGILALMCTGLLILYSASNEHLSVVSHQIYHFIFALTLMCLVAQIPPHRIYRWAPWFYAGILFLLLTVLFLGHVSQGARRWFALGPIQLQPSEMMKLALPMMLAWLYHDKPWPHNQSLLAPAFAILAMPVLLTAKQPDLGTAILIGCGGMCVIVFAGISRRIILTLISLAAISTPIIWHFLHNYQKLRIINLLHPEKDPLGTGYNIIQSKIAVGSGGFLGKGFLHGTQSHLSFLPVHTTDFIFSVAAEELGFIGCLCILLLFIGITARCLFIAYQAQTHFNRLLGMSLSLLFIAMAFINIGMVIGLLPVVGVPLPLISYGGSSMVTTCVCFGVIMSIQTHRQLWST